MNFPPTIAVGGTLHFDPFWALEMGVSENS